MQCQPLGVHHCLATMLAAGQTHGRAATPCITQTSRPAAAAPTSVLALICHRTLAASPLLLPLLLWLLLGVLGLKKLLRLLLGVGVRCQMVPRRGGALAPLRCPSRWRRLLLRMRVQGLGTVLLLLGRAPLLLLGRRAPLRLLRGRAPVLLLLLRGRPPLLLLLKVWRPVLLLLLWRRPSRPRSKLQVAGLHLRRQPAARLHGRPCGPAPSAADAAAASDAGHRIWRAGAAAAAILEHLRVPDAGGLRLQHLQLQHNDHTAGGSRQGER